MLIGLQIFWASERTPGVKRMFEAAAPKPKDDKPLESRADLRKQVDASYYGYNLDEEDGKLLAYEIQKEKEALKIFWLVKMGKHRRAGSHAGDAGDGEGWRLPTSEEVQEELVERRRRRLLDKLG